MTAERYNTPNHPRWSQRTNDAPTTPGVPRQRYGRPAPDCGEHRAADQSRADPPVVLPRDETGSDATIELRNTSDRVWITTELPDRSLDGDAVQVSVSGASLRIRAEPSDESPHLDGIDRTITLAGPVNPADVVIAYDDPVLTVIVPNDNS